jgi:hypothetical protein
MSLSDRTLKAIEDIFSDKENLDDIIEFSVLLKDGVITEEEFLIAYNMFRSLRGKIQDED